jgi:pimeloyl-ACP methyl ester carboxylesterase
VLDELLAVARGADPPSEVEISARYSSSWLAEVPIGPGWFSDLAPIAGLTVTAHGETARRDEARVLLELEDGTLRRFRCAVEDLAPHQIRFQILGPAQPPGTVTDRTVERDGRSVHLRDHGGSGPLLLLWHGAGCDATVWDGVVPFLRSFRVVALDLPGHGDSPLPRLSCAEATADLDAALDELGMGDPILVGHSLGGWVAVHDAARRPRCRGLVCLDGPSALEFSAMGLKPEHPGFLPDPPNLVDDLEALRCPTRLALCAGASDEQAEWMIPFRQPLADHIDRHAGAADVRWLATDHMMVLTHPEDTASFITTFVDEHID